MYCAERTSLYEEHQFYTALREQIERLVRRYCRANDDDVEDLTQECLLRVYNNLDSLRDLNKMEPWLRTVVRNAVFSWYRERKREQEVYSLGLETEHEAAPYSIPEDDLLLYLVLQEAMQDAVGARPPDVRVALWRRLELSGDCPAGRLKHGGGTQAHHASVGASEDAPKRSLDSLGRQLSVTPPRAAGESRG
jgi:RNA polymerase sigma factor (sigma-70 family)